MPEASPKHPDPDREGCGDCGGLERALLRGLELEDLAGAGELDALDLEAARLVAGHDFAAALDGFIRGPVAALITRVQGAGGDPFKAAHEAARALRYAADCLDHLDQRPTSTER